MKLNPPDEQKKVSIVLSRHNLLTLLVKLEDDDSQRTLSTYDGNTLLQVTAEHDDTHYEGRPPRGPTLPNHLLIVERIEALLDDAIMEEGR